jgi:class 3 adenylate cyclase
LRLKGHVLAADDNEFNRHIIQRWLQRQGHTVSLASNGVEALQLLERAPFDVILLDIVMPELNGVQVLARLKENPDWQHIPTIMITSLQEMDAAKLCIELGAEDYLTKPFQSALLEARIGTCLEKKRLRDREAVYLQQIEEEKAKYNQLLHSILPGPIVSELRRTGTVQSQRHEEVAVLFADIVRFTDYCEQHSPEKVVAYLQNLVQVFEEIAQRYDVQKIKTIGDSFMAAAGLLTTVANPVHNCLKCGLELISTAQRLPPHWSLRVGIHVGSVVAGVLGRQQYLYDLWGATVNVASRVEGNGRSGAVTLSEAAWSRVAGFSQGEPLGRVDLKGVGRMKLFRFVQFLG